MADGAARAQTLGDSPARPQTLGDGRAQVPGDGPGRAQVPGDGPGRAQVPGDGRAQVPGDGPGRAQVPGDGPGRAQVEDGAGEGRGGALVRSAVAVGGADDVPRDGEERSPATGLKGARSQLRRQMREKRRLRVATLLSLSVVVLGLLPLLFGIRSVTTDPVFASLDALSVPGWADNDTEDQTFGSRWCFVECTFRERVAQSERPYAETAKAYTSALTEAGWSKRGGECAEQITKGTDGEYTCWTRDEFTLDLWVKIPECQVDQVAANDPAVAPSLGPDGLPVTPDPSTCTGSTVNIKVQNAIADTRGKAEPEGDEPLTGETPDPVLTDDPLLDEGEPTPAAS